MKTYINFLKEEFKYNEFIQWVKSLFMVIIFVIAIIVGFFTVGVYSSLIVIFLLPSLTPEINTLFDFIFFNALRSLFVMVVFILLYYHVKTFMAFKKTKR